MASGHIVIIGRRRIELVLLLQKMDSNKFFRFKRLVSFVVGSAADVAAFQWIAPYTGVTLAQRIMFAGGDATIVFNDLSRHANAYRQISLLLRRPPAREAFPGDIFYLHSRLLERCAKLSGSLGGGSCTGFPIVQTQDGELSAYIPTNIVSITDGQILLDTKLFNRGFQPAVNMALSVSRIGSKAQIAAIKVSAGALRLELAIYRELERNRQFKDQLDTISRNLLFMGDFITVFFQQAQNIPTTSAISALIIWTIKNEYWRQQFCNRQQQRIFLPQIKLFKTRVYLARLKSTVAIATTSVQPDIVVGEELVLRFGAYSAGCIDFFSAVLVSIQE